LVVGAEHGGAVAVDEAEVIGVHLERHEVELNVHSRELGVQNAGVTGKHHGAVPCTTLRLVTDGAAGDDGSREGAAEPGQGRAEHIGSSARATSRTDVAGHGHVAPVDFSDTRLGCRVPFGQACGADDVVRRHAAEVLVVETNGFERLHRPALGAPFAFANVGDFVLADERTSAAWGAGTSADHFGFPANEDEPIDRLPDHHRRIRQRGRVERSGGVGAGGDLCGRHGGAEQSDCGREDEPRAHSFQVGHRDILAL